MTPPPLPFNDSERLKALGKYNLLDTLPEEDFDNITYLASVICQTPISLISLIDKDRQFFKSHLGININQTHKDLSFCAHAINQSQTIFEIEDARLDDRFHDNDFVIGEPNIAFYAGIPLVDADGFALGTLCVIDQKPRKLTVEQKEALTKLSKQVMFIIEARQKKIIEEELKLVDFTFNNSTLPILLIKEDSSIYNLNHAAAKYFGYTQEELKGKKIIDIDDNYDTAKWALHWLEIKSKGSITIEATPTKKDGTITNLVIHISYLKHGDLELICSYTTDITEKKKQEAQMMLVDFAFRNSTTPINIISKDASVFDFNEAANKLLGYTKEEYASISIPDIDPDYQYDIWPIHWEELKKAKSLSFESNLIKKNGEIIHVNIEANFIQYGNKELNCVFFTDISEKKKIEENLKLYAFTIENAAWGLVYFRADGSIYNCNLTFAKMFGYASLEEVKTKTVFELGNAYTTDSWKEYWDDLREKKRMQYYGKRKKKDGTIIDVEIISNIIKYGDLELNCGYAYDVTEKLALEKKLKIIDFSFRNATIAMHYWRKDGSSFDFNDAACKLLGYTPDEYKNLNIIKVSNRHTMETWTKRFEELKNGPNKPYITALVKKDQSWVYVEIRSEIIVYEDIELCFSSIIDVTEQLKAEEKLKRSNQRYEYATLATSDVIWEADLAKKEIFISKNFTTFFHHEVADGWMPIENNIWRQNIHRDDMDFIMENQYTLLASDTSNNKWEGEYRLRKADGSFAFVRDKTFAIKDENGKIVRMIGAMQDITKQKEAAEEKETLLKELVENNLELKQFSYITSHNLRAPLTNLVSICNMIKPAKGTDALTLKLIDGFKTSTYRLNETLNDLIEVMIIKENRNIRRDQLTFEEIYKKTKESLSISLIENEAIINADFSEAPAVIFANEYLESIFLNLFTNSVKYRHPNRAPIITIKTSKEPNGDTKLTFSDNGIGINMEFAKDKIFGLYKRFHNNANSKGIGLYLIHSQITTLGGTIAVESEVNIGTTFTITFK